MVTGKHESKYLIYLPSSIYSKKTKAPSTMKLFDEKYAQENIIVLITIDDLFKNKKFVREQIKQGYQFAVIIDNDRLIRNEERKTLGIMSYIIIDREKVDTKKLLSLIPNDALEKVVYEDISTKISDYEGGNK